MLLFILLSLYHTIAQTCKIQTDNGTFDLSKISGRSYVVVDPFMPDNKYAFSFCSNVARLECTKPPQGLISAVQRSNAFCFKLGTWDQSYVPGGIKTTFTGFQIKFKNGDRDFCRTNRSLIYKFECSTAHIGELRVAEPNACEFELTVPTRYACASNTPTCKIQTDSGTFDLSKISGRGYHVDEPDSGVSYDFSFCSNAVDTTKCPMPQGFVSAVIRGTGFCYKLGTWDQSYVPDGIKTTFTGFQIKFQNGDRYFCQTNRSVIYNFVCSSDEVGALTVSEQPSVCEYEVNVPTRYACGGNAQTCKIQTDSGTFDLSKISGRSYHVDDFYSGVSYDFSFCSNVVDTTKCLRPQGFVSAVINVGGTCYKLGTWDQSYVPDGIRTTFTGFQIQFQNGDRDLCLTNRSITYNFECSSDEVGALTVSESYDCGYEVNVPTRYACAGNGKLRTWLFS